MPHTHTRIFRVRFYECDAYGHLNNANYLRYMQEAAFDASADAGFDFARYEELGHNWLVRESEIEYLRPLGYDDRVAVKTWVSDFRRASSRRRYEFTHLESGELVARAYTDWVYLDTKTLRPATVPQEMARAFFPEGVPETFPPREPFPSASPPPAGVFKMRRKVAWRDLDSMQHVNNAVYLEYIEECGMQAIAAHRWPWTRMAEQGFAIFIRKQQIRYRQPALMDDELEISTWASNVRRSTATRHYTIHRVADGTLLGEVHSLGVWVDLETGQPIRIPEQLLADFAPNITESVAE
jgi:acyl-CoA thioester hydrolase